MQILAHCETTITQRTFLDENARVCPNRLKIACARIPIMQVITINDAHTIWTCVRHTTTQGQSASQSAAVLANIYRWALKHWLPPNRATQSVSCYRQASLLRGQPQPSYLAHALSANEFFQLQGVFGHRANLIYGRSRRGWVLWNLFNNRDTVNQ